MTRERRRSIDKGVECRKMKGKSRREQRVQGSRCMRRKDETSDSGITQNHELYVF
ncbi:hypothetical protein ACS0TY_006431 [Phlomoides rotata]